MKTLFTKLLVLVFFSVLLNNTIIGQGITLSYERDLDDLDYLGFAYTGNSILHTSNGFALYFGEESTGFDNFVKLRNNNTIIWKTQVDKSPDNIYPSQFYEHDAGYFFVGNFAGNFSNTGGIGRLNKITGNIEVKKQFIDLQTPRVVAISNTHGGNLIVGGSIEYDKAMIRVVNPLGDVLATRTNNQSGGLWGNTVNQIEKTNDNGYIISGIINENTICGEPNNTSWWICKLNSNLDVVWSRKYGDGNGTTIADKIVVLENNEIVVLGQTYCTNGSGGGINNTGEGIWLLKLNSSGTLIKQKFVGSNFLDYIQVYSDIDVSCDQNIVLAGSQGSLLGQSYFIEKFDINLEEITDSYSSFGLYTNIEYSRIHLQLGKDNSYLIYGGKLTYNSNGGISNKPFIAKTLQDPDCVTNPPLLLCDNPVGQYSICEDFDKLQNGNILPQGSSKFSLYSGNANEQATVTTERSFSGTKSLKFTNTSDINFNINRNIESPSRLEWNTYIESGKTGSWNIQTNNPSTPALIGRYTNGKVSINTVNNNQAVEIGSVAYSSNQWIHTALIFNNTSNTIEVWVDSKQVALLQNYQSHQVSRLNIYGTPGVNTNGFFIDNLLYFETQIPCVCTNEYVPVCVNGKEFSNSCRAACAGYTSNEWTQGPCVGGPTTRSVTLDIDDNVCGGRNTEIKVPIRVKDYKDIAGLQLRIASSNENIAEIVGVADIHPNSGMTNVDFAVVNRKLVLTYADATKTLSDGTILFSVRVLLKGNVGSQADINIEGDYFALDNDGKKVNVIAIKGSVCVNQTTSMITGLVTNTRDKGINNATINITSNSTNIGSRTTNTSGNYSVNDLENGKSYRITPEKDESLSNGVDISDLLLLRRHLQGITLFPSPYTYLAADMNADKLIDITDLLLMRRVMQGITTQLPGGLKAWRFVPKAYMFPTTGNPLAGNIPNAIEINNLTANQSNLNFIGVKYGDLDHNTIPLVEPKMESRSNNVELILSNVTGSSGSEIYVDVKVKNFNRGGAMQFSLTWPTDKMRLVNVPTGQQEILISGTTVFDQTLLQTGKLGFIWDTDDLNNGTTMADSVTIYRMKFQLIGPNNTSVIIDASVTPKSQKFLNADLTEVPITIKRGIVSISISSSTLDNLTYEVKLYPNPTTGIVNIESNGMKIEFVNVITQDGKLVLSKNDFDIQYLDLSGLPSGIYTIKMGNNDTTIDERIVLIE